MANKKTALIIEGGGQRGVFSFGITDTFIARNYDPFDIYIGVSNGVAVLCWYLIRETDNNLDKEQIRRKQNRYCYYQKQNPHTPRAMEALGLDPDDIRHFIQDCLFPEISSL